MQIADDERVINMQLILVYWLYLRIDRPDIFIKLLLRIYKITKWKMWE